MNGYNNDNAVDLLDFAEFASSWLWADWQDDWLVGFWKFDAADGNTVEDFSSYDNNAELVNGAYIADGLAYFDGVDDYARVENSKSLAFTNQLTVSAWIYISEFTEGWPKIVVKPYFTNTSPWELFCLDLDHHGNRPRFIVTEGVENGIIEVVKNVDFTLNSGQWYHIAGVYDGQEAKLYVDGQLVASEHVAITFTNNDMPLSIGSRLGTNCFNGYIDEIKIFNRGLTEQEIDFLASWK